MNKGIKPNNKEIKLIIMKLNNKLLKIFNNKWPAQIINT